jgi:hypothetical protein
MKKLLFFASICFSIIIPKTYGQQEFKVRYFFSHKKFLAANLNMVTEQPNSNVVNGYVLQHDGTKLPIHGITQPKIITPKTIHRKLKGIIDFRDGDMLYFHFWDITSGPTLSPTYVTAADNGNDFTYQINWNRKGNFSIPFSYRILTATNIPFKYDFFTKTTKADFLNFNLAYFFVFGRTKIYENDDIKPRNFYFGIGPYAGITSIEDNTQGFKRFGITYGASTVFSFYGLNLVESFGLENGFTNETSNPHFYIGIGLGYNLISLFDPSN